MGFPSSILDIEAFSTLIKCQSENDISYKNISSVKIAIALQKF